MIWLTYYTLASWCVAAVMAIWSRNEFEAISQTEPQVNPRLAVPIFALSGPLWMPYLLLGGLECVHTVVFGLFQVWQAHRFRQTYREYSLRPASFFQLPQEVRDFWDSTAPTFFQLNFSLLGDFQLRDKPYQMHDRFYWHESGTANCSACALTIAGISVLTLEMTSWLENGTNVITTTVEHQPRWGKPTPLDGKLHITHLPGASADEVFARHCQAVAAIAREYRLRSLAFDQRQLETLVIYKHRVFCTWLNRLGRVTQPPAPVLPEPQRRLSPDEFLAATAGGNA